MNVTWMYQKKPTGKPLTPAQTALLDAIKAAGTRTFDASAWNVRTVWGLFHAGLIYVNCDGNLKTVALIVHESPVLSDETPAAPAADSAENVTPIGAILSDKQLLNGRVQYQAFAQYQVPVDPAHKDLLHTGIITATHNHPLHGLMVRIQPDENTFDLVAGWFVLKHHVKGWAVVAGDETPAAVLADELPNVAIDVLVEETPAPIAAHMTDTGRFSGIVGYVDTKRGYGYVDYQGDSTRFDLRSVFGGAEAMAALKKGAAVSFGIRARVGASPSAVGIVIVGHAASESRYTWTPNAALPRPRRNDAVNTFTSLKLY